MMNKLSTFFPGNLTNLVPQPKVGGLPFLHQEAGRTPNPQMPARRPGGIPGDSLHLGHKGGCVKLQPGQDPVDAIRKAVGDPNADVRPMPNDGRHGIVKVAPGQDPVEAIRKAIGDPNADVRPAACR